MPNPFRYYLRVRYGECDMQRVVFNGHYGTYVDLACTEFLTAILPNRHDLTSGKFEFQLVRQVIEWTAPARFAEVIEITVRCARVGTTSFHLAFEFRKPGEPAPFVTAQTVNVLVDGQTWKKTPIGAALKERLETGAPGLCIDHAGYLTRLGS